MPGRAQRLAGSASSPTLGAASVGSSVALYATPSFSSLIVEPDDLEPGPGTYELPRTFGYQHLSTNLSQPQLSLTAKHEKSWDKVFITKDHQMVLLARGTPGPGTYDASGDATKSQARIRFGTARARGALSDTAFRAPGPVYDVTGDPETVEKKQKFGKDHRFESAHAGIGAAPGQYEAETVFNGSRLSKSFGCSHRAYDKVRFPGSERLMLCKASPGPGALQPFTNSGKSISFCRAERMGMASGAGPGPGAYDNHEKAYPHSKNRACYGFGKPSAKGRMDYKQMKILSHSSQWGIH